MRRALKAFALLGVSLAPLSATGQGWLGAPISCDVGRDCWVVQHFDHDPGSGALDYQCGPQAYDAHQGVDISIGTAANIARNVPVVAAAAGVVKATRDGEEDGFVFRNGVNALRKGVNCGNAVVLEHGNGWTTNYCHLRRGSVAVRKGQRVNAGERLGAVGMSGKAEFPHLHFTVRYNGRPIDPYAPHGADARNCGSAGAGLWSPAAATRFQYKTISLTGLGLAPERPNRKRAAAGQYDGQVISSAAEWLVAWAFIWDVKQGDTATFQIADPSGRQILANTTAAKKDWRRWFPFAGQRVRNRLAPGTYRVSVTVKRPSRPGLVRQRSDGVLIR